MTLDVFIIFFEIFFLPFVRFHSEITPLSKCLSTPIIGDGEMVTNIAYRQRFLPAPLE